MSALKHAKLYRMVMPDHTCPYGLKSLDLLKRKGYKVEDKHLASREQTDVFVTHTGRLLHCIGKKRDHEQSRHAIVAYWQPVLAFATRTSTGPKADALDAIVSATLMRGIMLSAQTSMVGTLKERTPWEAALYDDTCSALH